ncbi:McrB family protein [Paenibacillus sp. GCM10028914]|uniref:McrB family protein n=1 Tax=Paenibacillus sp. GCM10028914 TaxID=3273416 RepID=UPI0036152044
MFRLDPEEKRRYSNISQCLMLGTLTSKDNLNGPTDEPVMPRGHSNNPQFFIKPVSPEPVPLLELNDMLLERNLSPLYIGLTDNNLRFPRNFYPAGYTYTYDLDKRIESLRSRLENKLIVFRPQVNYMTAADGYSEKIFKNLEIKNIDEGYKEGAEYVSVPKLTMGISSWESSLQSGKALRFQDYYFHAEGPKYVICGEYLYKLNGNWKDSVDQGWAYESLLETVERVKIDPDAISEFQIYGSDNLVFLDRKYLYEINSTFTQVGNSEKERLEVKQDITIGTSSQQNNEDEVDQDEINYDDLESQFLEHLKTLGESKGLFYHMNDLVNFHVSVKTNPITVLAGMSGTGKSQLALLYAEAMGLKQEKNTLLVLPISPSYTEPSDLLGYLNASTGLYVPSDTGFVEFLKHAKDHPEQMHIVAFDEMNLSQVEYWFAPFISILELPENQERKLRLYNKETATCHNRANYPDSIGIGDNIVFIGTANIDETTKNFSDRFLDRANIVTLRKLSFSSLLEREFVEPTKPLISFGSKDVFTNWSSKDLAISAFSLEELKFFDEIHDIIQQYDYQKGVSHRVIRKIGEYLNSIPLNQQGKPYLDRKIVIDLQCKQRILTKIRGSSEQFQKLIGVASENQGNVQQSELFDLFTSDRAREISDFEFTLYEIHRKAREMAIHDYAS